MNVNVELFLHGNPAGQKFYGKADEQGYISTFYNNNKDPLCFTVETRMVAGQPFCYYHYLVYQGIVGNDNRPGAYFGMTLRFDCLWTDFMSAFRVLDSAFHFHVVGNILKTSGAILRYAVNDFKMAESAILKLQDEIVRMLRIAVGNDEQRSLGNIPQTGKSHKLNLYDLTVADFVGFISRGDKLQLSPHYPSQSVSALLQQKEAEIRTLRDQAQSNRDSHSQQLNQSRKRIQELTSEVSLLKQEIGKSKTTAQEVAEAKKINALVHQIKEPVAQLSALLENRSPGGRPGGGGTRGNGGGGGNSHRKSPFLQYILYALVALIGILLGYGLKSCATPPAETGPDGVDSTKTEIGSTVTQEDPIATPPKVDIDLSGVKLDINPSPKRGNKLVRLHEYQVEALQVPPLPDGAAPTWDILPSGKAAKILRNDDDSMRFLVTGTGCDSITIVYKVEESKKERTLHLTD